MKNIALSIILSVLSFNLKAQERHMPDIPDIPGYKTLICDFHMHTVFSDGEVWPTIRVDEAWRHGLDAIAITDHLEYLPHKKDIITDHNRACKIAKEYAVDKNVIVIAGTEITKGMPPGHLNALFIKDATPIYNEDFNNAVEEAASQGAFIMWNHPGWKAQQPDTMKWWDEHSFFLDMGWLHGIEVVNYGEFYPQAVDWAMDSGLTILGNSDMHGPFLEQDLFTKYHRSVTLVFATERSEGGIRDALFNGRTAAYNRYNVIGKPEFLEALFLQSVIITKIENRENFYTLRNKTDLHFDLVFKDKLYEDWTKHLSIKPGYEASLRLPEETDFADVVLDVQNFIIGTNQVLSLSLSKIQGVYK